MTDEYEIDYFVDDQSTWDKLVAAGWVALQGNIYVLTEAGCAALRRGLPGKSYGPTAPVDSVRQRTKPPIKKKKHRRTG